MVSLCPVGTAHFTGYIDASSRRVDGLYYVADCMAIYNHLATYRHGTHVNYDYMHWNCEEPVCIRCCLSL
jgi:hypothetical protein